MKIREHRGSLAESLKTTEEIEPTLGALTDFIAIKLDGWSVEVNRKLIKVEKYGRGIDDRCGWDTHIVTLEGFGVFGMTDAPLSS